MEEKLIFQRFYYGTYISIKCKYTSIYIIPLTFFSLSLSLKQMHVDIKSTPSCEKKYKTLDEAEDDLGINYFSGGLGQNTACDAAETSTGATPSTPAAPCEVQTPLSPIFSHSPHRDARKPTCYGDVVAKLLELMPTMTSKFLSDLMQTLFCTCPPCRMTTLRSLFYQTSLTFAVR